MELFRSELDAEAVDKNPVNGNTLSCASRQEKCYKIKHAITSSVLVPDADRGKVGASSSWKINAFPGHHINYRSRLDGPRVYVRNREEED